MQALPFIFSPQTNWRLMRHGIFWLLWFLFSLLLYSFTPSPLLQKQGFWVRLAITWPDSFLYLIPQLFLAYSLMYGVIPKLVLPGRYLWAVAATCLLFVLTAGLSALLSLTVVDHVRRMVAGRYSRELASSPHLPFYVQAGLAMLAGLRGSITIGGLAAAIKLMKCFYERQQAALTAEKEKVHAELQMLKAQLHPHFLFNTLNNIYSYTQEVSETASGLIMGLSALLRYMLYEGSRPLVPLDNELKMAVDYLSLEKARYGKGLDMALNLPKKGSGLQIAPLILLPFIENAFKHGAGKMIEHPWISLTIQLNGPHLQMKLINGKNPAAPDVLPGIGIANVRKRLQGLYPGKHELNITEEDEMYIVNLAITLTEI